METQTESWRRRTTECLSHKEPANKPHKSNHVIRPACLLHEWADLPIFFFPPSLKSCSWKWNTSSVIWGGNNIIIDLFPWGSFTEVNDVQRQELHYPRFPVKLIPSRRVSRSRFAWEVKKWLLTASNPDEEKEKKPRQTFPGSAAPTWKGFNVTSLPAPALSDVERPASALFSLQPSTLLVCWSSRLTRCDLTPLDFHTGGKLPSCLTTSMFIDPVLPLPRGPGSHTRFYFPLS